MPPISQQDLDNRRNRHVVLPGHKTVLDAVQALEAANGQEWWHLIVDLGDGHYLTARFSDLRERAAAEGEAFFYLYLDEMGEPLREAPVVDQSTNLEMADQLAEQASSSIVVVTVQSEFLGVLCTTTSRGLAPGGTSLSALAPRQEEIARRAEERVAPEAEPSSPPTERRAPAPAAPEPPLQPAPSPSRGAARDETPGGGQEEARGRKVKEGKQISVDVGGDVANGGQVIVAGDDVNITHYHGAPPEETREQFRRFEAAYPQEAHLGTVEKLHVAVLLPDAPSPFGESDRPRSTAGTDAVGIDMPVDPVTGKLKPVDIEITVTATGFRIKGDAKKKLTVWPDGRTSQRWFLLEPGHEGQQQIMVELTYKGRLLDELTLEARVFAPEKKARSLLNLSLQIVSFSLQVSFAAG